MPPYHLVLCPATAGLPSSKLRPRLLVSLSSVHECVLKFAVTRPLDWLANCGLAFNRCLTASHLYEPSVRVDMSLML